MPWRDLPERFGPWKTCYERHRRWSADGTWRRILDELRAIRAHLRRRGIKAVIPEKTDQQKWRKRRGAAGGRPVAFDSHAYKDRNVVEICQAQCTDNYRAAA